jgi:hypothetical protein
MNKPVCPKTTESDAEFSVTQQDRAVARLIPPVHSVGKLRDEEVP